MNYIGSSLFIINMDFNYKYYNETEEDKSDMIKYGSGKNSNGKKNGEMKDFFLPPIK